MNIIDAIKTAKAKNTTVYVPTTWSRAPQSTVYSGTIYQALGKVDPDYLLSVIGEISHSDLFREDYQVSEPEVTITRTHFWDAVSATPIHQFDGFHGPWVHALARKLGLEKP